MHNVIPDCSASVEKHQVPKAGGINPFRAKGQASLFLTQCSVLSDLRVDEASCCRISTTNGSRLLVRESSFRFLCPAEVLEFVLLDLWIFWFSRCSEVWALSLVPEGPVDEPLLAWTACSLSCSLRCCRSRLTTLDITSIVWLS